MKNKILTLITLFTLVISASAFKYDTSFEITNKHWGVMYYSANGNDETARFAGKQFVFNDDGSVFIWLGGNPVGSGTYKDDGNYIQMEFSDETDYADLTGSWKKAEENKKILRLLAESQSSDQLKELLLETNQ